MAATWPFAKYHGNGNGFLAGTPAPGLTPLRIRQLCDPRHGIGADGVILLGQPGAGGRPVKIFNSDGSPASFSGNGIRCGAALLFDADEDLREVLLLPPPGPVRVRRGRNANLALRFRPSDLNGGSDPQVTAIGLPAALNRVALLACQVVLGNPHVIVQCRPSDLQRQEVGQACEALRGPGRKFPDGVNVSLFAIHSPRECRIRTWERGVGPTPSCASAAAAAFYAGSARGLISSKVTMIQEGGKLNVRRDGDGIVLAGRITRVCTGLA